MSEHQAEETKLRVERLSEVGAKPEDIATELQLPLERFQELFHNELEIGRVRGRHVMLEKIYDNAASGTNLAATSFWIKAQCGWRDTGASSASQPGACSVLEVLLTPPAATTEPRL